MDTFRVRLNCLDHYQSNPSDFDPPLFGPNGSTQARNGPQIPVIRVFGSTETGQKVCAHVHGALPYLFIEYRGSLSNDAVTAYMQQLRVSIDHALAVSYRRNIYDGKATFVAHITLVKGVPFFGYHVGYRHFLKIYLLNPLNMTRFADLLYQGAIMGTIIQPFEAHAQYLQQWMCDYNLFGCAYMDCRTVRFRDPVPTLEGVVVSQHKWHEGTINQKAISSPENYPRLSHCSLEVDVRVEDILNRDDVRARDLHHNFLERLQSGDPGNKFVHSLSGLWRDETRRRRLLMGLSDPSSSPFPPEVLISMSADSRDTGERAWIHEAEYAEIIEKLVEDERVNSENPSPSFDDFVLSDPLDNKIKTVFESVEDLFPSTLLAEQSFTLDIGDQPDQQHECTTHEPIVDEDSIPSFEVEEFPYESDEDIARQIALSQSQDGTKSEDLNSSRTPRKPRFITTALPSPHSSPGLKQKRAGSFSKRGGPDEATQREVWRKDRYSGHEQRSKVNGHGNGRTNLKSPRIPHLASSTLAQEPGDTREQRSSRQSSSPNPNKRQKVTHDASNVGGIIGGNIEGDSKAQTASSPRPGSRHVKFQNDANDDINVYTSSGSQSKRVDNDTPSSSQLSQSSVKASGDNVGPIKGFTVSKYNTSTDTIDSRKDEPKHIMGKTQADGQPSFNTTNVSSKSAETSLEQGSGQALTSLERALPSTPYETCTITAASTPKCFPNISGSKTFLLGPFAPTNKLLIKSMTDPALPSIIYQDAFYSNEKDVPDRVRDYAGREFKLESTTLPYLPSFDSTGMSGPSFESKELTLAETGNTHLKSMLRRAPCLLRNWEIESIPPSHSEVRQWVRSNPPTDKRNFPRKIRKHLRKSPQKSVPNQYLSQIDGPTQKHKHGSKYAQKQKSTSVRHETQYMSTLSLEIHVNTRESFVPNPEFDEVSCIFWCLRSDEEEHLSLGTGGSLPGSRVGIIVLSDQDQIARSVANELGVEVHQEREELDLINRLIDTVREFDPDIITGYEVHNSSWGYLVERARIKYEFSLCDELSRMKSQSHGRFGKDADRWGFQTTSTLRVTGRHTINIWRAMRSEVNLLQYTMENLVFHLLQKRVPHYTFRDLTQWYKSGKPHDMAKTMHYFISRVQLDLEVLDANELIPRTSEQARLIGVDFFSVFSRGSQFKVESFMFRIAKPESFVFVSPSRKQVGQQNALECLPLVMEPQSAFYNSPLLVLDFQSLYPSIMIAYNYCYSTCLGRVVGWRGQNKMGFAEFKRQPRLLELVKDSINIAPNGMMYVKPEMRKSLLAKMLGEILETRVMVKSGMKVDKDDATLQQLLNNRQLALKLLANVTYGYTSASFSGRMPCAEIADSIVQTARETLEKAIALIHSVKEWGAEVVYGDTDSLFVYLKGRTKSEAFDLGQEIAKKITESNPRPIKLKFEKVYFPCVLLAKKRYVGFKYESKDQAEPEFDAKGIETVRRDGTPAEQKIEETALKLLFRTADLSQVKNYFQRQCAKIMQGKVSIQDFCFAKEVKLGHYSDKGLPPPGALISTRKMLADPRTEPQYGERVPYVVATGAPGARLIDRCVAPEQLLKDEGELDAEYYILKNLIPPLERIFNLVGANVRQWYDEMPKIQRVRDLALQVAPESGMMAPLKKTMESYMKSSHCLVCRTKLAAQRPSEGEIILPICDECQRDTSTTLFRLRSRLRDTQKKASQLEGICRSCSGFGWAEENQCDSKDCPVYYSRVKARAREQKTTDLVNGVGKVLEDLQW